MPGIARLDVGRFRDRIVGFKKSYISAWQLWVSVLKSQRNVASCFGLVLRRWQACRPNRMRRPKGEAKHSPPYLEDLIAEANAPVLTLRAFDMRLEAAFTPQAQRALEQLWNIFERLSYHGRARNGLAGAVGISKAVLLLTEGRVGPAFDSKVRSELGISAPENAREWIQALWVTSRDIRAFEAANQCTLQDAAPPCFADLRSGRI